MKNIQRTIMLASAALLLAACSDEPNPNDDSLGGAATTGKGGNGADGGEVSWGTGAGGTGGAGGLGGIGGAGIGGAGVGGTGGVACSDQGFNLVDLTAPYDPPGLPFEQGSANANVRAAAASVPGSLLHYWRFDPLFGSNDTTSVTLELTCHNSQSADLELTVIEARFQNGDWKFDEEGDTVSCGQSATFNLVRPNGVEPNYLYRVQFADGAAPQYVEYTIGAAAQFEGTAGTCVADTVQIEPAGDDAPSTGEALSATSGTISAPFGNTIDFITEPDLFAPVTETVSVDFQCTSPHLELQLVTVGDVSQLRYATQVNSNDRTLACGESALYGINPIQGQTRWFAMVTTTAAYDYGVDGAIFDTYNVTIL